MRSMSRMTPRPRRRSQFATRRSSISSTKPNWMKKRRNSKIANAPDAARRPEVQSLLLNPPLWAPYRPHGYLSRSLKGDSLMTRTKHSGPRPLNVFVAPRSKAEQATRNLAANAVVSPKAPPPQAEAAAPGFRPHPELDLHDQGGKIIKDLIFTNLYVGGANSWDPVDIKSIDTNLAAAMSDKRLNNVLLQYFRGAATITSTFRPSTTLPGPAPNQFSMGDVEALVRNLRAGNQL